jgi:hypothetical protein
MAIETVFQPPASSLPSPLHSPFPSTACPQWSLSLVLTADAETLPVQQWKMGEKKTHTPLTKRSYLGHVQLMGTTL